MSDIRFENAIIGIHVWPKANKPMFNIVRVEDLALIGSQDEVAFFSYRGDVRFGYPVATKLGNLKKNTRWSLFERQTADFVASALAYWNAQP